MSKLGKTINKNIWVITNNLDINKSTCSNSNKGMIVFSKKFLGGVQISLESNNQKFLDIGAKLDPKTRAVIMNLRSVEGQREATEQEAILLDAIKNHLERNNNNNTLNAMDEALHDAELYDLGEDEDQGNGCVIS